MVSFLCDFKNSETLTISFLNQQLMNPMEISLATSTFIFLYYFVPSLANENWHESSISLIQMNSVSSC